MAYIFLDESGDLGFNFKKKKTSKYFVITCLFVKEVRPIEKIAKKIFAGFNKTEIRNHGGMLHAYKEKPATRQKILGLLNEKDVSIISIYLNKSKVYTRLQDEKHVLYNYVTNILLDRIYTKKLIPTNDPIVLIASRRETNRFLNDNFCNYLSGQVSENHKLKISIEIRTPQESKCLQIVDCVCWSLFRKREHDDESYANLIKSKIVEESPLFS
jgi:arsenate reductase-like glutaredoxin family protein